MPHLLYNGGANLRVCPFFSQSEQRDAQASQQRWMLTWRWFEVGMSKARLHGAFMQIKVRNWRIRFCVLAIALGGALPCATLTVPGRAADAANSDDQSLTVRILEVSGRARLVETGKKTAINEKAVGRLIGNGASIETRGKGVVVLELYRGGPVIAVKPDSLIGIDEVSGIEGARSVRLNVERGCILGCVDRLGAASKFEIATPRGVIGIRGTVFEVCAEGLFRCYEGMFMAVVLPAVVHGAPPTFSVKGGNELDARKGVKEPTLKPINAEQIGKVFEEVKRFKVCERRKAK